MLLPTMTQIARSIAAFERYQDGCLWYALEFSSADSDCSLSFPVPVTDAGEGAFLPLMKGVQILRWARQHVQTLRDAMASQVLP